MSVKSYGHLSCKQLNVNLGHRQNWFTGSRLNRKEIYNICKIFFIWVIQTQCGVAVQIKRTSSKVRKKMYQKKPQADFRKRRKKSAISISCCLGTAIVFLPEKRKWKNYAPCNHFLPWLKPAASKRSGKVSITLGRMVGSRKHALYWIVIETFFHVSVLYSFSFVINEIHLKGFMLPFSSPLIP